MEKAHERTRIPLELEKEMECMVVEKPLTDWKLRHRKKLVAKKLRIVGE